MYTTPRERERVKDEFLSDLMDMGFGDEHTYYFGATVICAGNEFMIDDIPGYGLFAAADTLADAHRQYCQ
jgi:hypothetical protein